MVTIPFRLVHTILQLIQDRNQILIDELYFMLIKQLTQNSTTILLYAQLMALVCSLYPPSLQHLGPFLNYFYVNATKEKTSLLLRYWKFYIKRICRTFN
jgi:hypothetical protein